MLPTQQNLDNGVCRGVMRLGAVPTDVKLSADDSLCVIVAADGCTAYDFSSGRLLSRYAGHASEVADVAISGDAGSVLTAGADATLRLWSAASGENLICMFVLPAFGVCLENCCSAAPTLRCASSAATGEHLS